VTTVQSDMSENDTGENGAGEGDAGLDRESQIACSSAACSSAACSSTDAAPGLGAPVPIPVLAPYLGLVAAVLCAFGGGWLLLAPYAFDFRHGAARVPRAMAVDLETGAAIVAVAITAAALFSVTLVRRLRVSSTVQSEPVAASVDVPESAAAPAPEQSPGPEVPPQPDPGAALRDLLTPLVAALAADLRSRDLDGRDLGIPGREHEPRRQEP